MRVKPKSCESESNFIETKAAIGVEEKLVEETRKVAETFEGILDVKIECRPVVVLGG